MKSLMKRFPLALCGLALSFALIFLFGWAICKIKNYPQIEVYPNPFYWNEMRISLTQTESELLVVIRSVEDPRSSLSVLVNDDGTIRYARTVLQDDFATVLRDSTGDGIMDKKYVRGTNLEYELDEIRWRKISSDHSGKLRENH